MGSIACGISATFDSFLWKLDKKYNNYVKMEVFCWSIELPDPSNYGLTLELKPKQKAEASIIARAQQGL